MIKNITLEQLKRRRFKKSVEKKMIDDLSLDDWNMNVYRVRLNKESDDFFKADHITHNGNARRTVEDMLDRARIFLKYNLYSDEEWENIILPIVNKNIQEENSFIRYRPGYKIRCISGDMFYPIGTMAIVKYDYGEGFGGRDYSNISACILDKTGKIVNSVAWLCHDKWEIIDKDNTEKYIKKMRRYLKGTTVPYYLSPTMADMLYN